MEETTNTTPETTATQPDAAASLPQEDGKGVPASPRIHDISVEEIKRYAELFEENGALNFYLSPHNNQGYAVSGNETYIDRELEEAKILAIAAVRRAQFLFGITFLLLAVVIGYDILVPTFYGGTINHWLPHTLPRLIFIILIQIFAYFYFSLTKVSLSKIQYLLNEKTNYQMKLYSLKVAILLNQTETVKRILIEFSQTERNFIIDKDKSTVYLEKIRHDAEYVKNNSNFIDQMANLIEKIKLK
jgi:hypothetical protein